VTVVDVVVKTVCITQTMVSIPKTMVFSNEKIFLTAGTIFLVNQKMVSGFATMVCVSHTKDSDTKTMVCVAPTIVGVVPTTVEADT
jgi:hypothetical protein